VFQNNCDIGIKMYFVSITITVWSFNRSKVVFTPLIVLRYSSFYGSINYINNESFKKKIIIINRTWGCSCTCHKAIWEIGDIDSLILNLSIRVRWVIRFIPQPLPRKVLPVPISGLDTLKKRRILHLPVIIPQLIGCPLCSCYIVCAVLAHK
jgi:hypothetical protein